MELAHEPNLIKPKREFLPVKREFYWDPYITLKEDIKDGTGKVLYNAGFKMQLYRGLKFADLLFLDGTSIEQVHWALAYKKKRPCSTLMLVKGLAVCLSLEFHVRMYEDPDYYFAEKFGIESTPAIVAQKGERILIREFDIE